MPGKFITPYDVSPRGTVSSPDLALRIVVAQYTALITLSLQAANLVILYNSRQSELQTALDSRPGFLAGPWPRRYSYEKSEDVQFALKKLKALLNFGAEGPDGSAEELKGHHVAVFAGVQDQAASTTRYKLYAFHAEIWNDGTATWGYEAPIAGEDLPGINSEMDLDAYLQSLARIDIQKRLEAAAPSQ